MSNTTTLAQLRTRARERSDQENSTFVSPTELLSYINASYQELYDILVGKYEDYYTTKTTSVIASGDSTITLPTDFYKLRGIDFKLDTNTWVAVGKFNFIERNVLNRSIVRRGAGFRETQYRVIGGEVQIEPEDSADGTYRIWYTPLPTLLSAETDTIDGIQGWEEYVIIDVAIKMMAKEESSTTHLEREKAAMLTRIESMAANRDSGQPETISDTTNTFYDSDALYTR
tara:strand:- start:2861 stop:3547 length:687 start_codon:yes stop_codon:yes gene_type:complete